MSVCADIPTRGGSERRALEGELILSDGTPVAIHPLEPHDRDAELMLFERLSPTSRFNRFLTPKPTLSECELDYLADIDHVRHEALVAIDLRDGSIVGIGRYVQPATGAETAELAVEVADEFHNRGVGTALAERTMQRARENGFATLTATIHTANRPSRVLARRLGFRVLSRSGVLLELELPLQGAFTNK